MKQSIGLVSLVVREYDEAIAFYVGVLGFTLVEDTHVPEQRKRWVVVAPSGSTESRLLLARASSDEQAERIGSQTGGRVFLFLYTDNFVRDYQAYKAKGVTFVRGPTEEPKPVKGEEKQPNKPASPEEGEPLKPKPEKTPVKEPPATPKTEEDKSSDSKKDKKKEYIHQIF